VPPPPPPGAGFTPNAGYVYAPGAQRVKAKEGAGGVLATAIVGLFCCGVVLGPVAAVKASGMLKEMDSMPTVQWTNRGTIQAARIIGIIATVLAIVSIVYLAALRT
jgi:hypothetical protein